MTAVDGDPLTGDPGAADVRHLLDLVKGGIIPVRDAYRSLGVPIPVIHEACGLGQCGGCSSRTCRTRRPGPVPVELAPAPWYDGDHIDGSNS